MVRRVSVTLREIPELRVSIDRLVFVPADSAAGEEEHRFVYFITIRNDSNETVTIKGRKWVVTDEEGDRIVVEGDGVVGETPRLEPGETFTYNSAHPVRRNSVAEGAYFGVTEGGVPVFTRIPKFALKIP
jgi:ApaG protein